MNVEEAQRLADEIIREMIDVVEKSKAVWPQIKDLEDKLLELQRERGDLEVDYRRLQSDLTRVLHTGSREKSDSNPLADMARY